MPNRHGSTDTYRYGFNGKEKDDEVKGEGLQVDYGFRIYDPRLGKFLSMDPLTSNYPWFTPYQYAGNKPIKFKDLDGLEEAPNDRDTDPYETYKSKSKNSLLEWLGILSSKEISSVNFGDQKQADAFQRRQELADKKWNTHVENAIKVKKDLLNVADIVLPVNLAHILVTGQDIEGNTPTPGQIAMEIASVVPIAKWLGKGFKVVVKHGDGYIKLGEEALQKFMKHNPCGCFVAGTEVLTDDDYKNIEDIKVGDLVWAYDDKTQKLDLKPVTNIFSYTRDHVYKIYFGKEVIEATKDHPFFIGGKWIEVKDIKIGDKLTLYNGKEVLIDNITYHKGEYKVFNFEVADFHTYYVSNKNVLVHNTNCDNIADLLSKKGKGLLDDSLIDNVSLDGFFEITDSNAFFHISDIHNNGIKGALRSVTDLLEKAAKKSKSEQATIMFTTVTNKDLKDPKIGKEIAEKLGFDFKVIEGTSGTNVIWTKIME
ncbi:polymorphic toxin-type HINT domain-containing protein [Winogradskyella sp.]|uniref:polymorphic toxin-type HINT domain-containing protein n=1 Tax=Winogradskyella sp. TaxID=1883156 RepID=UPI003BAD4565